ncbi:MAG TPA: hypothetical protein VGR37_00700 [Longimicrobiaceae bacterium]|nr:hypothetical protein [Longimicrobiaceae bacterium]
MHTEHLQNVRPSWIAFGWFAAAAVVGLALVVLASVGILDPAADSGGGWVLLAVLVGFFSGGWLVGWRTGTAPVLHGVGIGLFSLVVWFFANLLASLLDVAGWTGLSPTVAAASLLLQIGAAVFGAWYGTHHHALNTAADD